MADLNNYKSGKIMKISKNFTREEFACKCGCGQDTVDVELVGILQTLRQHFSQPITITSGNRCEAYNAKIGGAKGSLHLTGRAADIVVANVEPEDVYNALDRYLGNRGGLGVYNGWIHIDTRTTKKARWDKRA